VHQRERPNKCKICGASFKKKAYRDKHIVVSNPKIINSAEDGNLNLLSMILIFREVIIQPFKTDANFVLADMKL
jgi:hypothetical protein